ncbi:phosphate/phosphite/phosphonate ABC transporter substrate-binding protein [Flavobacterium sp. W21_SRS_FM6]|uniref:phosphate/phosphite/phosphonate ABC transporter substrate-binding protein n=1 Tax=Flavobacterium sp. W21_SRS_FM6 TaxID=3240268 RepID=UPI003F8E6347
MKTIFLVTQLWLCTLAYALSTEESDTLLFAIVPQQSAERLVAGWSPILQLLSSKTGINLQFVTAPNIPLFEQRLASGDYDIAYMNPYHFVHFNQTLGFQALAHQKDRGITGVIVTRKDSLINSLSQLAGQTIAFPAPAAFAATLLPRAELKKANVLYTARYVSSHDSVYLGVAKGLFPAGGGVETTLNNTPKEIREQLTILWHTDTYTPHAIATHPRVTETIRTKLQQALFELDQDPEGRRLLSALNITGFQSASNDSWNDVKALELNLLSHQ